MLKKRHPAASEFWFHRAAVLAFRLNFHLWLDRMILKLVALLALVAVSELLCKELALPAGWSAFLLFAGLGLICVWSWLQARGKFCTRDQALVKLENELGFYARLSSARAGVGSWPPPQESVRDGFSENWGLILMPWVIGIALVVTASLIPASPKKLSAREPLAPPPDLTSVQNWINALKAQDMIQPEKLQEMQSALDKLRNQPPQDWYSQNSLEASAALKELMQQAMNSLSSNIHDAQDAVQSMKETIGNSGDKSGLQPMEDELRNAGQNLASGNLPLNKEILGEIQGCATPGDKAISAEQLRDLQNRLAKGEQTARTAPHSGFNLSEEMQAAMACDSHGRPGPGGLGGGTESAPLSLQDRDQTSGAGHFTPVSSDDMKNAALGPTMRISAGSHQVDKSAWQGVQAAGAAQVSGNGGEAVWTSVYDPQESDVLTRFFK